MDEKITIGLKWIATVLTLIGAVLTSLSIDPLNIYFLNVGSILFIWWAFRISDLAMITVNLGLFLIYGYGTALRILN